MEQEQTYRIDGMKCGGCSGAVQSALLHTEGVRDARVSHEDGTAAVTHSLSDDEIIRVIEHAGYKVTGKAP